MKKTASITCVLLAFGATLAFAQKKSIVKANVATIEAGEQLISKSDCFACHKPETRVLGPSYLEIAEKYPATEANLEYLIKKTIDGGSGVWGQIPMSPHTSLSQADAKKMIQYILALKPKEK